MDTIDLFNERDILRGKGIDIIVEPVRCGKHSFKRRYTFKIYYRTEDGLMDESGPLLVTGSWESYYIALEEAVKTAKETLERTL